MLNEALETLKAALDDARVRLPGSWMLSIMSCKTEDLTSAYSPYLTWRQEGTSPNFERVWDRASIGDLAEAIDDFIARRLLERDAVAARNPTPDQLAATLGV